MAGLSASGVHVLTISGPARAVLAGERTALNFVGRLSGIATLTADYVRHNRRHQDADLLHPQDHARACGRSRNTPCAAAAASIIASGSTTRS